MCVTLVSWMDHFILPHLDETQHEDERTGTPYFAIALASVALRAEPVRLEFLCSFLLLLLFAVFGSCSVERVCPTLLQWCSFQPQAPLKHIIINQEVWLLCVSPLLLNYVISNENIHIHIPFFLYKCLRAEQVSTLGHTGLWFVSLPKTDMQGKSPRARATREVCKTHVFPEMREGRAAARPSWH